MKNADADTCYSGCRTSTIISRPPSHQARLRIDEIRDGKAVTSYTRWLEAVQVKDESVFVTLNPRFKRIWLEVKKRLVDSAEQTANPGFRSQYAIRFFSWAKKHVGTTRVTVDEIRKFLGLESVKDADGKSIREAPLSLWANFRQRALDLAIGEINKKTDLNIELESIERAKHRRVTGLKAKLVGCRSAPESTKLSSAVIALLRCAPA
jgi:hypothetical protein